MEAGKAEIVAGQESVASPDNPSAYREEGRKVRSELSCMSEKVIYLQLATEMGVGRYLRLLSHARV